MIENQTEVGKAGVPSRQIIIRNIFESDDLGNLLANQQGICISMYMPVENESGKTKQNPIRLGNMIAKSGKFLQTHGVSGGAAAEFLEPANKILSDPFFWVGRCDGLALFLSESAACCFRLPIRFEELVVANNRFHLGPLINLMVENGKFYVLTLNANKAKFYQGSAFGITDMHFDALPKGVVAILPNKDFDRNIQLHGSGSSGSSELFHGQGGSADAEKNELTKYFRAIDRTLHPFLADKRDILILAAVDRNAALYREINTYPHLAKTSILCNPKNRTITGLFGKAFEAARPHLQQTKNNAIASFVQAEPSITSTDPVIIVAAARQGKIQLLLAQKNSHIWGAISPLGEIDIHQNRQPVDDDLVDAAVVGTFLHRGTAFVIEQEVMPQKSALCAILRK